VFKFTHPLGSVKKTRDGNFKIYIGNKHITTLQPQYFSIAKHCPKKFFIMTKNQQKSFQTASEFFVDDDVVIEKLQNIRVNVIGYSSKGVLDESGQLIRFSELNKRYSIDKAGKIYRVEFYSNDGFCSMNLMRFK
jgi:hypothetical protein